MSAKHIDLKTIAEVHDPEIASLAREVLALRQALGTLIAWLPMVANAPIRADEAERLLDIMESAVRERGHDQ